MQALRTITAAFVAVSIFGVATVRPASADGAASTRNILIGVAALAAGAVVETNVAHKRAEATTIEGYLSNGSPVYEDGHVVGRNGNTWYPGNHDESVSCSNGACYIARR